jgi:hypothetical protein
MRIIGAPRPVTVTPKAYGDDARLAWAHAGCAQAAARTIDSATRTVRGERAER